MSTQNNDERVKATGDQATSQLWHYAVQHGMSRRRFLQLLSTSGAAAVLVACGGRDEPTATPEPPTATPEPPTPEPTATPQPAATEAVEEEALSWFKDPEPFIQHGTKNLETRLENLDDVITPNELFFVRNNSVSYDIDPDTWRLVVEGDAVETPLELTLSDIMEMSQQTLACYIECGGNQRAMFDRVMGQPAKGTQWMTGGVSNATWEGVPLNEVLKMAGVKENAVDVMLIGLDVDSPEEGFRRAMPIEKAMDPDTILAHTMNGEALPKDHGFPLRAVVPGWVGSSNIKWLGKIEVSSEKLWSRNNTTSYVLIGDAYPPEGEALGQVATKQSIKSALALPWPAELAAGTQRIHGFAQTPDGPITKVEWSADGGESWSEADVLESEGQYSWTKFEFDWNAAAGEHTIMTRATDEAGNTQPDEIPWNEKGYLFNQPLPHPITVA